MNSKNVLHNSATEMYKCTLYNIINPLSLSNLDCIILGFGFGCDVGSKPAFLAQEQVAGHHDLLSERPCASWSR